MCVCVCAGVCVCVCNSIHTAPLLKLWGNMFDVRICSAKTSSMQLARLVAATCVAGSSAHALLPNRSPKSWFVILAFLYGYFSWSLSMAPDLFKEF